MYSAYVKDYCLFPTVMLQVVEKLNSKAIDSFNDFFNPLPATILGNGGRAVRKADKVQPSGDDFHITWFEIYQASDKHLTLSDMSPREWPDVPSSKPSSVPSSAPSSEPSSAALTTTCEDADQSTFKRGCDWVKLDKKKRCQKFKDSCPRTCGKCPCQDNRFKRFIKVLGKVMRRGCNWARKNPNGRCNSERIMRKCKKSCKQDEDTCPEEIE